MHLNSGLCSVPWPEDREQNEGPLLNTEGLRYLHQGATEIKSQVHSFLKAELSLLNTCILGADYRIKQMMTEKDTTVYLEYHKYNPGHYLIAFILQTS